MIDYLSEEERSSAYEYLYFLLQRPKKRLTWDEISRLNPDREGLNKEEEQQLKDTEGFIAMEKAIEEYDLWNNYQQGSSQVFIKTWSTYP